jgi:hypothetical protein
MAFWKFWTIFVLTAVGMVILHKSINLEYYLIQLDITHLSLVILGIFFCTNIAIGYYSYLVQFQQQRFDQNKFNNLWFSSDAVLSIGMIGTLIGFLIVLINGFTDFDTSSTEQMKKVIAHIATGMGVAIITTLTGLVCSLITKLQLMLLEGENEKI